MTDCPLSACSTRPRGASLRADSRISAAGGAQVNRRSVLKGVPLAATALVQVANTVTNPFGLERGSSRKARAAGEPPEEWEGFLLLRWGQPIPATVEPPPAKEIPLSEGPEANARDDRLVPREAASRYAISVPVLDIPLRETASQVRSVRGGQAFWVATQYYAEGPREAAAVSLRRLHPVPVPVEPFGSPGSQLINWEKVDYLPKPGIALTVGPRSIAMWVDPAGLFVLTLNADVAPGLTIQTLAARTNVIQP